VIKLDFDFFPEDQTKSSWSKLPCIVYTVSGKTPTEYSRNWCTYPDDAATVGITEIVELSVGNVVKIVVMFSNTFIVTELLITVHELDDTGSTGRGWLTMTAPMPNQNDITMLKIKPTPAPWKKLTSKHKYWVFVRLRRAMLT
jgi:hypothetical protein